MEITRYKEGGIHLSQTMYIRKLLEKFKMEECKAASTPVDVNQRAEEFRDSELNIDFPYREAVGSLIFLCVGTRPDIQYAVGLASRHLESPTNAHVNIVKRILRYLKQTTNYGIRFEADGHNNLLGYSDADYAGDVHTRRSTSGVIFMLNGGPISWESTRQKSVALSTTESKYIAATVAVKELIWLSRLLNGLISTQNIPMLHIDNHFVREKFE